MATRKQHQHYDLETRRAIRRRKERIRRRRIERAKCIAFLAIVALAVVLLFSWCIKIITQAQEKDGTSTTEITVVITQETLAPVIIAPGVIENHEETIIDAEEQEELVAEVNPEAVVEEQPRISAWEAGTQYYYKISEEDRINLVKVVYEESRGEPFKGKVAVASVVLNRYASKSSLFDTDSVTAVIVDPYQFADISRTTQEKLDSVPECAEAVDAALRGWDPTREMFPDGALYFFEPAGVKGYQREIREGIEYLEIGNHRFHNEFNVN